MEILYIMILALLGLVVIIVLLALALYHLTKKSIYLSDKEKDYILFVSEIYESYSDDLGIQTKEQHEKLVLELNKINDKLNYGRKQKRED